MEYIQVQDEDSHRYVIPFEKLNEWNAWRDLSDEQAEEPPAWATRLDGGYLIFKEWRIGWQYEG